VRPTRPFEGTLRAGYGFEALHVGSSRAEVLAHFGTGPSGEHEDGRILSYLGFGVIARFDESGYVHALTFGPAFGREGLAFVEMDLPDGIEWGMLMPVVREKLGEPVSFTSGEVVAGSGRTHHVADWPGLRLTFDDSGKLTTITVHSSEESA